MTDYGTDVGDVKDVVKHAFAGYDTLSREDLAQAAEEAALSPDWIQWLRRLPEERYGRDVGEHPGHKRPRA